MKEGFDLMALNREFAELLEKHDTDTDVQGESRKDFLDFVSIAENDPNLISYHAAICNAWDELCDNHHDLRKSGLSWYCGGSLTDYPKNPWDIYIGTGDELDED